MEYEFEVKDLEEILVAVGRDRATVANLVEKAMPLSDRVWKFLHAHPEIPQPGINIWIYLDDGTGLMMKDEGVPIEIGAQVSVPFVSEGPVVCSKTPSGTVAATTHVGPYEKMPEAHRALRGWAEREGLQLKGPNWEVYGHWDEDPERLTTDIYYLLA